MTDIKKVLLLWFKTFDKRFTSLADKSATGGSVAMLQNEQLANEL